MNLRISSHRIIVFCATVAKSNMCNEWKDITLKKICWNASLSDIPESDAEIRIGRDVSISSTLSVQVDTFACQVRVPRNCLEGIWNKAAELLKTKDAIAKLLVLATTANLFLVIAERGHILWYQKKETLLPVIWNVLIGKG